MLFTSLKIIIKFIPNFIDSKTSGVSVAAKAAQSQQIPTRSRHVFLDNERSLKPINQQFNRLIKRARTQGDAIGIGHPNTATLEYLSAVLPLLDEAGIDLVSASELVPGYKALSHKASSAEPESIAQLALMPE